MSKFRETKKEIIDSNKEKGDTAIEKGQELMDQLQDVKSLYDSIELEDDSDAEMVEALKDSYAEEGQETFQSEVQEALDDAHQNLESNKSEISAEKTNVEDTAEKVAQMQGITDIAKSSASSVESALHTSIEDYVGMENETETIESEQSTTAQNILSTIKSLF